MTINLILYQGDKWILGKFADRLSYELKLQGHTTFISKSPLKDVDVNHHIIYYDVTELGGGINTLMVTHIDAWYKWKKLKLFETKVDMFICMSSDTQIKMIKSGIRSKKICYINPAHDQHFKYEKIRLGFFSNIYNDGRKLEVELTNAILSIDHSSFTIVVMGLGWENIINKFKSERVDCEWYSEFNQTKYIELIGNIDYLVYTGFDEGSMSFLDAVMANKKTIVTSQGFHLDVFNAITHPIKKIGDIKKILENIYKDHNRKMKSISSLTWENYAKKHSDLWQLLYDNNTNILYKSFNYKDGIKSVNKYKIPGFISSILFTIVYMKHIVSVLFKRSGLLSR